MASTNTLARNARRVNERLEIIFVKIFSYLDLSDKINDPLIQGFLTEIYARDAHLIGPGKV